MTDKIRTSEFSGWWHRARIICLDLWVTLVLWIYFTLVFLVCFAPFYLPALLLPPYRVNIIRFVNHYFYRGFFRLCRWLIPTLDLRIDPAVKDLRGTVIVCNHLSYLDSILMISLFKKHTTIVKDSLFHIPVLSWVLRLSGYLPSSSGGDFARMMMRRMETLCDDLSRGANLFVFPEGTRSRSGAIGKFNPGAFKLARLCRKPIRVVHIRHSDKLYQPGRFLFNAQCRHAISLSVIGSIHPDYDAPGFSITAIMNQARNLMIAQNKL